MTFCRNCGVDFEDDDEVYSLYIENPDWSYVHADEECLGGYLAAQMNLIPMTWEEIRDLDQIQDGAL